MVLSAARCGLKEDDLLIPLPGFPSFVGDWRSWIGGEEVPRNIKELQNNTNTGFPCGSSEFVKRLEMLLGVKLRQRKSRGRGVKEGDEENLLPFLTKK